MNVARIFTALTMLLTLSSCGAPLFSATEPSDPKQNADSKAQKTNEGENLLKAYGCPNRFDEIPLCARVLWVDDLGKSANGPITWADYWKNGRKPFMSAKLLFWSAVDGWPIDPRSEFPNAKQIRVKLFMPTMGHGTMEQFPAVSAIENRVGQFSVTNLHFVMASSAEHPWDVRIQLKTDHNDADFEAPDDPNVWKQKILQFTKIEKR